MAPSLASLEANTGAISSPCLAQISSWDQPAAFTMISLVTATASGPFAVIRSANSIAPFSASPGSVSTLTKPHWAPSSAVKLSPVKANSSAF